ncbi:MAG: TraR/DksA family transcriptional regulator [Usitatibacter sp.]
MTAHLDPHHRDELQARLEHRARILREEVSAALRSEPLGVPADDRESGDVMASVAAASIERDTDELHEIVEALERMKAGSYGVCIGCGATLPLRRLEASPQARRCLRCENEHERGHAPPTL